MWLWLWLWLFVVAVAVAAVVIFFSCFFFWFLLCYHFAVLRWMNGTHALGDVGWPCSLRRPQLRYSDLWGFNPDIWSQIQKNREGTNIWKKNKQNKNAQQTKRRLDHSWVFILFSQESQRCIIGIVAGITNGMSPFDIAGDVQPGDAAHLPGRGRSSNSAARCPIPCRFSWLIWSMAISGT